MPSYFEGDVIRFKYAGGSNPGGYRTVYVVNVDAKNLSCWDFGKQDLRTFTRSKMDNVEFVGDVKYIDLSVMPANLANGKKIAQDYEQDGYKCYINGSDLVAVKVVEPVDLSMKVDNVGVLEIPGPYGTIKIYKDYKNKVTLKKISGGLIYNATSEDLQRELNDLFIPF